MGKCCSFQSSIPPLRFDTCTNPRPVRMAAAVVLRTPARQITMILPSLYCSISPARAGTSLRGMRMLPAIWPRSSLYSSGSRTSSRRGGEGLPSWGLDGSRRQLAYSVQRRQTRKLNGFVFNSGLVRLENFLNFYLAARGGGCSSNRHIPGDCGLQRADLCVFLHQ